MKSYAALIIAGLAAAANAVQFTNSAIDPEPGKPFELTWEGAKGSVTINLKTGPSSNLKTVEELASGLTGDSYTFTLDPADYPSGTYAFEIVDSGDPTPNYSEQFAFQGTGELPTASSPSTAAETTSSASRSSSATPSTSDVSSTESESETSSSTTSSRPSRTSAADEEETSVPGAAGRVASPLALILVTVAAMAYFN